MGHKGKGKQMATRKKFLKRCAELGVTVKDENDTLSIDAPPGHIFIGTNFHWGDISNIHRSWRRHEMYDALIEEMSDGVAPCTIANCDACFPDETPKGAQ